MNSTPERGKRASMCFEGSYDLSHLLGKSSGRRVVPKIKDGIPRIKSLLDFLKKVRLVFVIAAVLRIQSKLQPSFRKKSLGLNQYRFTIVPKDWMLHRQYDS